MTATGSIVEGRSNLAPVPNFFSSDPFFEAVANAFYPGRRWQAAYVGTGERIFRVLVVGKTIVDTLWQFPIYYEPIVSGEAVSVRHNDYLACVAHSRATYEDLRTGGGLSDHGVSPFIDWSEFESWEAYLDRVVRQRALATPRTLARGLRNLERDRGPVEFRFHDDDASALETAIRWKSAQYRRTGVQDRFADPSTRRLYDELTRKGLLTVSTLRTGGALVSATVSMVWAGRCSARLMAFDPALARYSPGRQLLVHLLEASYSRGDREFDFLLGGEAYKWGYATHARLLGPVGDAPFGREAKRRLRSLAGSVLVRWPALLDSARAAEGRIRGEWRGR